MAVRRIVLAGLVACALAGCQTTTQSGGSPAGGTTVPPSPPSTSGSSGAGSVSASASSSDASSSGGAPSSSSASATTPSPGTTSPSTPPSACRLLVDQMSTKQQAGQLLMMGVNGSPLTESQITVMGTYQIGSVVLLGQWNGLAQVKAATRPLTSLNMAVPVVVAADQEGGSVQRLQGKGLPPIPSARKQASLTPAQITANWSVWGKQLKDAGVRWNLAPVADVVPASNATTNAPIGRLGRNYGATSSQAAPRVAAAVTGMDEAGIATSLKHFPGLGQVTTNTDFGAATDTSTTRTDQGLQVFRAGVRAGASSVMISSAVYAKIDPDQQGVFSRTIITGMLRGDLGYTGVVISDDLGAAVSVAQVPAGERAVRFVSAGGDVVINANPGTIDDMSAALVAKAKADPAFAARVSASATRVVELKQSLGLVRC